MLRTDNALVVGTPLIAARHSVSRRCLHCSLSLKYIYIRVFSEGGQDAKVDSGNIFIFIPRGVWVENKNKIILFASL